MPPRKRVQSADSTTSRDSDAATPLAHLPPDANRDSDAGMPVVQLPLDAIRDSPRNPRERLRGIQELADSMHTYGLLQAVLVRPIDTGYVLIAGHPRLAAARMLGWSHIPAVVRGVSTENDAFLLTLTENLQRDDLSPREQSRALEILVRERGWSTRQIARAVQRSPAFISKRLRVFEDDVLAPLVLRGSLAVSVAEELLPLPAIERSKLAQRAATEGWDRPTLRSAIQQRATGKTRKRRPHTGLRRLVRDLRAVLDDTPYWDLNETQRGELRKLFLELVEAMPEIDMLVTHLSNHATLVAGIAAVTKQLRPRIRLIGVDHVLTNKRPAPTPPIRRPASGRVLGRPVAMHQHVIEEFVDEIVVVTQAEVTQTASMLWSELEIRSGSFSASAIAAILSGKIDCSKVQHIGAVITTGGGRGIF